jgi:hypothetical protein
MKGFFGFIREQPAAAGCFGIVVSVFLGLAFLVWWGATIPSPADTSSGEGVRTLFKDSDGYEVKMFHHDGRWHYYVTPGPVRVVSGHMETRGKSMVFVPEDIDTVGK